MAENDIPPVETPPAPPAPVEPPAPAPLTEAQRREIADQYLKEINYRAAPVDDPVWTPPVAPVQPPVPTDDDFDFTDPKSIQKIVDQRTKELPSQIAADVTKQVMEGLAPVLNSFASNQISQGVREEAKPYVEEIMKEFKVTPFQLAQDPRTQRLVNEAAEARAIKAGKIGPSILFPNEPPYGGVPTSTASDDVRQLRAQVEFNVGRKLTDEEFQPYIDDFKAVGGEA